MRWLVVLALLAGTAHADDGEVRVDAEVTVTAGAASNVSVTLAGLGGRVVSKDGPVRVTVSSSTLTIPRARYTRKQAADPAADAPRFDLRLTAPAAGDHQLAIDARFWVCGKKVCVPVHLTRAVTVHATSS